ncbi:MAG TPA: tol-pal system protein YbgF [Lichenihabitans sp.]|jgi:tol-pal system protein YbgF|nr:tol-pal system protein YbgF [Lichenihabitans sp.]
MAQFPAPFRLRVTLAALGLCALACHPAAAGEPRDRSPPLILAQDDPDAQPPVDDAQSNAGLLVRISRLEDRLRTMTGQIEELQFQNKKLEDQLRKLSQDVDFRFQDLGRSPGGARPAPQKRGDAGAAPDAPAVAVVPPEPAAADSIIADATPTRPAHHGDAFDPAAAPGAPGAPKPLGTTPPSEPLKPRLADQSHTAPPGGTTASIGQPHAPLDLTPSSLGGASRTTETPAASDRTASLEPAPDLRGTSGGAAGGTRADYDSAFALYKSGQYDAAITGFQDFLGKYPKDRYVPDATYFLGESFARLGRQREAAEQFLKMSTDYNRSNHAPDAMLRLGVALNALGAKEQACATYQEVDRKYPSASADVRAGVERELKRSRC